jgi:competence protein ComEC
MPPAARPELSVYVLNVGQADTQVIRSPEGRIVVVDAVKPSKLKRFLKDIGLQRGEPIEELIITHAHTDHFTGASGLLTEFDVQSVSLAPFWHHDGWGSNSYRTLVNRIEAEGIPVRFVSGYERIYPDDLIDDSDSHPTARTEVPYIEILGPSNALVEPLEGQRGFERNHLSIMARVVWGEEFSMVLAGDAQMENWSAFDREGMLRSRCRVLSSAHHGSMRGTQWERLERLNPKVVLVSSDPMAQHDIPDAIGCAIFREYEEKTPHSIVAMTSYTGTVEIEVESGGTDFTTYAYGDGSTQNVSLGNRAELTRATNTTDWDFELSRKLPASH